MTTLRSTWLAALILVTGYTAPAIADVTISVDRAAVRYRCWMDGWQHSVYESRRAVAIGYDQVLLSALSTVCLTPYGQVSSDAAGWNDFDAQYTSEVAIVARWSHGQYVGAEAWMVGRRRDDVYSDAMPGMRWVSAGIAGTIQPNLTYWSPGEWNPPPLSFGCEGAKNLDAALVRIPMSASIDYLFYWWRNHGFANPTFGPLTTELGIDAGYGQGRCEITIETYDWNVPYTPPTWTLCRERADFTIVIPSLERVAARDCADFNADGIRGVPDLFAFLTAWFDADVRADRTGEGVCGFEDIAEFLGEWFAGA